ncbi:ABC transporter permease [Bacteroidia bacterium]|nr:ABC transporter permease [Bacteroidia bacterium]
MNADFFIAKRICLDKDGEKRISPPAIRIALASMALGLVVMLLSVAVVVGFKKEVRNKVIGFGGHIQITHFNSNTLYETYPIAVSDTLLAELEAVPNVSHVQKYASKPVIIKTKDDFQGVVLKGVDETFNWDFFRKNLKAGEVLQLHTDSLVSDVLISQYTADKLNLKLHDTFICYFIQEPPRARKYRIAGIYQTNFIDYDKLYVLGDIQQIRRLNDWDEDMVSGLELTLKDYDQLDQTLETIYYDMAARTDRLGNLYYTTSIRQLNPGLFAWLNVLDMNVVVIFVLMVLVAGFSMISGLLIIILERANMIGVLKALGENNTSIRRIFLYISVYLIGKGLLWGNAIALILYWLQRYTGIFKLNPEVYYVSAVPVDLSVGTWLLVNIITLAVTLLMLIGPSYLVARISPAKTIRFE